MNLQPSNDSVYITAMSTKAGIQIQKIAQGPPTAMAVATPATFPTIPDSTDISAWKGEMFPSPVDLTDFFNSFTQI